MGIIFAGILAGIALGLSMFNSNEDIRYGANIFLLCMLILFGALAYHTMPYRSVRDISIKGIKLDADIDVNIYSSYAITETDSTITIHLQRKQEGFNYVK